MCGRFTLTNKDKIKKRFDIDLDESFNICPSTEILVLTNKLENIKWGYSPRWAKTPMNLINARYETIHEKPSFKDAKRWVFIMDGWYEWKRYFDWKRRENIKDPYYHHLNSNLIYTAGLYNESGCACVTKESVQPVSDIHNRQPLPLEAEQTEKRLVGDHILKDYVSGNIQIHKVSTYVNSPRNNDYKCIQPI